MTARRSERFAVRVLVLSVGDEDENALLWEGSGVTLPVLTLATSKVR